MPAPPETRVEGLIRQGRRQEAIRLAAEDLLRDPGSLAVKEIFMEVAGGALAEACEPWIEEALLACLRSSQALDCQPIHRLWLSHLAAEPAFRAAFRLHERIAFDPLLEASFERLDDFSPLRNELFLAGLRTLVPPVPVFEAFMTHVRRRLLLDPGRFQDRTTLAAALAEYAFNTGYILHASPEEEARLDGLGTSDEDLAVYACYRPLGARGLPPGALEGRPALEALGRTQVDEPLRLARIAVPPLTGIAPDSAAVRERYETFPYPAWRTLSPHGLARRWRRSSLNQAMEGSLADRQARILVAGCGTGQEALACAALFPKAEVLAVDLSRNSLAYAMDRAEALGIGNVAFRQADLLRLEAWPGRFDFIVCSGVLHHLAEPERGWRILRALLAPGGLMKIALYSQLGRRQVQRAREAAAAAGLLEPRAFRRAAPSLLDPGTLRGLAAFVDYYHYGACQDLLFHPLEHGFTVPRIAACLAALELDFLGFQIPAAVGRAYGEEHPDDPGRTRLEHWHAFETRHPDTFRAMYAFWCRPSP